MKMLFFNASDYEKIFLQQQNLCDFEIIFYDGSLLELFNTDILINDIDIICIPEKLILGSEVLSKFSNLRIVASRSKNCSNIDLYYCMNNRIAVVIPDDTKYEDSLEYTIKSLIDSIKDFNKGLYINRLC